MLKYHLKRSLLLVSCRDLCQFSNSPPHLLTVTSTIVYTVTFDEQLLSSSVCLSFITAFSLCYQLYKRIQTWRRGLIRIITSNPLMNTLTYVYCHVTMLYIFDYWHWCRECNYSNCFVAMLCNVYCYMYTCLVTRNCNSLCNRNIYLSVKVMTLDKSFIN